MNPIHPGSTNQQLTAFTGYLFIAQFCLFIGFILLLPSNAQFLGPSATMDMASFLPALDENSNGFFTLKSILIALRTSYGISFIFLAMLFWERNKIASAAFAAFTLVSVAMVNAAQLMGIALIPMASDYAAALSAGDQIRTAALEASAFGLYTVQDHLDIFVIAVTFNGCFVCLFALFSQETELKKLRWLIPIMMILPFNRMIDLPTLVNAAASLTNVVVTAVFFLMIGRFYLKQETMESGEPAA